MRLKKRLDRFSRFFFVITRDITFEVSQSTRSLNSYSKHTVPTLYSVAREGKREIPFSAKQLCPHFGLVPSISVYLSTYLPPSHRVFLTLSGFTMLISGCKQTGESCRFVYKLRGRTSILPHRFVSQNKLSDDG